MVMPVAFRCAAAGLWLAALSTGCASMRASHLAHLGTVSGPQPEAVQAMSPEQRRAAYDLGRLTWDGQRIQVGEDSLGRQSLQLLMDRAGAPDLARALETAQPAYLTWMEENPGVRGMGRGLARGLGSGGGGGANAAEAYAIVLGTTAVGISAYIAGDSLLRGIASDLNPKPCLEDVLEAYNQRLAYALGLNTWDAAIITSMPRWSGLSGRDHGRLSRLVRAGMAAGLGLMVVSSTSAWLEQSQGRAAPTWCWPAFYGGSGALLGFGLVGMTVAW